MRSEAFEDIDMSPMHILCTPQSKYQGSSQKLWPYGRNFWEDPYRQPALATTRTPSSASPRCPPCSSGWWRPRSSCWSATGRTPPRSAPSQARTDDSLSVLKSASKLKCRGLFVRSVTNLCWRELRRCGHGSGGWSQKCVRRYCVVIIIMHTSKWLLFRTTVKMTLTKLCNRPSQWPWRLFRSILPRRRRYLRGFDSFSSRFPFVAFLFTNRVSRMKDRDIFQKIIEALQIPTRPRQ